MTPTEPRNPTPLPYIFLGIHNSGYAAGVGLSIKNSTKLLRSKLHSRTIVLHPVLLIQLLSTLCGVLAFPSVSLCQASPTARTQDVPASTLQHDPDIPVLGTEEEWAEAKQSEAKEEALKSP